MTRTSIPLILLFGVLAQAAFSSLQAQQTRTEFGKNRVQFHDKFDEWLQYESENYITYWYGEARNIGETAVLLAEANYPQLQALLEHQMSDKLELIVYTDLSDLKQSNIGADDAFRNEPGRVKVEGNKIFVYYNGDHADLQRQIREGTASVILSSMMYGENLQEIVQNAVLLDIPLWFSEGLVAYCGEAWSVEADEELRLYLLTHPRASFEDLMTRDPRLAGHAWWRYIAQTYGKGTIGNLLYLTRISRSVDNAIDYVYSMSFDEVAQGWEKFYRERAASDAVNRQVLPGSFQFKNKHRAQITQLEISPDGQRVAYVLNEIGKQQIFVYDLATAERERVFKVGYRNAIQATDYRYPILSWSPDNRELAVVYEQRDVLYLRRDYPGTKDPHVTEPLDPQLQAVYSADYIGPNQFVLTATVRGVSDLYLYYAETRQTTRLTDDHYDDLDASAGTIDGMEGVYFTSNRPDTSLAPRQLDSIAPTGGFNVFFLPSDRKRYNYLIRLTNSPDGDPRQPRMVDSSTYAFVDGSTGIPSLYTGQLEEYVPYYEQVVYYSDGDVRRLPDDYELSEEALADVDSVGREPVVRLRGVDYGRTDLGFGIDRFDVSPLGGRALALVQGPGGGHEVFPIQLDSLPLRTPRPTVFGGPGLSSTSSALDKLPAWLSGQRSTPGSLPQNDPNEIVIATGDSSVRNPNRYLFQSPFEETGPKPVPTEDVFGLKLLAPEVRERDDADRPVHTFRPARIRAYQIRFRTDYITTTFDNQPLFGGLDNFASTPEGFRQQPAGLLVKVNTKELFEDYILELGARFATTFDASEYYAYIDSRKSRIDKRYGLYRRSERQNLPPAPGGLSERRAKSNSLIALTRWSYPFDVFSSLRATASLRFDTYVPQIVDDISLGDRIDREQRVGLRLEYVFDNTLDYALNIKHGSRAKVYTEVAKRFDVELIGDTRLDFDSGLLTLMGFDARHYQRVLRHSVLAVRLAGATTFGAEKILFYLGSTDGALGNSFNNEIPVAGGPYAYEMAITNQRGFRTNIRNGNSFALVNTEFRFPVLRYLFPRSTSNFLRSFQLVGFADAGTAWTGANPFTPENPINTQVFDDDPAYTITVNYFRDPVVYGYGGGARLNLFGYFVRADYAWGIETKVIQKPRIHLSIGLDF